MSEIHNGLFQIGQIAIPIENLDRAVNFYRDVLGLPFLFRAEELAFFRCGVTRLMLSRPETDEFKHYSSVVYYQVEDLKISYRYLKDRGADPIDQPHMIARMPDHELWMAFFKDSEGNTFALMSEVHT